ncbi:MAG TPA: trypsin-like serine protease [Myxococcota bacterium]|nr:trypsin-like serine protease [Myxococcota bacterium]HQK50617.1 trypsin-like serine protease [Myxococcota bacterium]
MRTVRWGLGVLMAFLWACGDGGVELPGMTGTPIINGAVDTTDVAVVALTYQGAQFCTGTVIASRTVVTAGHCLKETGYPVTQIKVFFGTTVGGSGTTVGVIGGAAHSSYYVRSDGAPINDVAYLTLAQDAPVAPMPWQQTTLPNLVGQTLQMVGYGVTNAYYQTGNGTRRTVDLKITGQDSTFLYYGPDSKGTCQGDSGGPTFATINGVKTLVAVTSYGDSTCVQEGANTRVDTYASFIASHLTGTTAGGGTSGGGTTPPTTPTVTALQSGVALSNLSGATGSWQYFSIQVPSGQQSLQVAMSSGTGDADLYVRQGALPDASNYQYRPYLDGNAESVSVTSPAAGTWYIGIHAYSACSGVKLVATVVPPTTGGTGGGTTSPKTEVEPNNAMSTAQVLPGTTTLTGKISSTSDIDVFRVDLPAGRTLQVTMQPPSSKDYDLAAYDASGTLVTKSENDKGLLERFSLQGSSSGTATVYVVVYGYNKAYSTTSTYTLTATW